MPALRNLNPEALTISLNISLPAELELRLFEAYQTAQAASFASLQADIAQGMADVHAGRVGAMDMTAIKAKGWAVLRHILS